MSFDLFQSRRNCNIRCKWWSRDESEDYDEDELIYKRVPSGMFYAKEVNAEVQDDNVLANMFMLDKTSITIMSGDDLTSLYNTKLDIKNKVIVEYQGEIWRVENVQKRKARIQNSEFGNPDRLSHYWYLSLIKG